MKKYVVLILIMFAFFATQLTNQSYAKYSNNEDITNELKSQGLIDVNEKQIELKGKEKEEFSKLNNVPDEATVTESGQNEYAICNGELSYFDGLDDYIDYY